MIQTLESGMAEKTLTSQEGIGNEIWVQLHDNKLGDLDKGATTQKHTHPETHCRRNEKPN